MIDTFTGWIEGFPTLTEKAKEVVKQQQRQQQQQKQKTAPWNHSEIWSARVITKWQWDFICFQGHPRGLWSIGHFLLSPLCLEVSAFRKSRKSQPILKISDKKLTQKTSLGWKEALAIALLHTCVVPKEQIGLSPYEMLYGRPFVYVSGLFLDLEAQPLQSYTMAIGKFQQDIHLWSTNQDPKDSKESPYMLQVLRS